jgi:hypothetical protein
MRRLTIEFPAPGESGQCDVIDEYGRRCDGLCWGEMLEQVARLTMPHGAPGRGYRMQTPEQWQAERDEFEARLARQRAAREQADQSSA